MFSVSSIPCTPDQLTTVPFGITAGVTLFCDFDGPIVDVSARYHRTYRLGLAQTRRYYKGLGQVLPLHCLSKSQFWQLKQNRVPDVEIALRSGLQGEQIEYFMTQVQHWVNHPALLRCDRLQPGTAWALSLLKHQGFKLVLVTLREETQVRAILERYGLADYFSDIYGTCNDTFAYANYSDVKVSLLQQAMMDHILQAPPVVDTHTPRPHPIPLGMVGDTEADILAARAVGIPAFALTCGTRSQAYLDRLNPDHTESNLLMLVHRFLRQSVA